MCNRTGILSDTASHSKVSKVVQGTVIRRPATVLYCCLPALGPGNPTAGISSVSREPNPINNHPSQWTTKNYKRFRLKSMNMERRTTLWGCRIYPQTIRKRSTAPHHPSTRPTMWRIAGKGGEKVYGLCSGEPQLSYECLHFAGEC